MSRDSPTRTSVHVRGRDVTPRPTDSTVEFENLSDEAEELCYRSFFRIYVSGVSSSDAWAVLSIHSGVFSLLCERQWRPAP